MRWRGPSGEGTLLFRRLPAAAPLVPSLLPYLARRGAPVPRVLATGIPPRHAPEARPWALVEAPPDRLVGSASDARRAGEALRALHDSLAGDRGTLEALGVPVLDVPRVRDEARWAEELLPPDEFARVEELASAPGLAAVGRALTLVHGALARERVRVGTGIVLVGWARAHLGSPLADAVRLADALGELASPFLAGYGETGDLAAARVLARLLEIRWRAWEARAMLRARADAASLIRAALG